MSIELSVITSYQEFKELSFEWESFRQQQNDNIICNSWEWLNTWIDVFGCPKDQLYLHIWRKEQEIVGLIPCYLKSTFAGNELRFLATGEPVKSEICSEFQDFILSTEFADKILIQFSDIVIEDRNISAIIFDNVLETSIVYKWLEGFNNSHWLKAGENSGKRYIIPVKGDQITQLSSFRSKNIKRHVKQFTSDSYCRVAKVIDKSELTSFYQLLITEHNKAWKKRGKSGVFEQTDFIEFHRLFSYKMLEKNKLVAFTLEHKNETAALFYGIIDGDILYYYQSAINHESKLSSAGVAMHVIALNIARENNIAFYDLMKGSDSSYKTRYIHSDIKVINCSLCTVKYKYVDIIIKIFKKAISRILNLYHKLV